MGTDADTPPCTWIAGEHGGDPPGAERVTADLDPGMVVYNSVSPEETHLFLQASSVPGFILQSK